MTQSVYLSLGSNVGDREANLDAAVNRLQSFGSIETASCLYETEPVGETDQPHFLNLVLELSTNLLPLDLLTALKRIESVVGRHPTYRWGPRVLDIDILLYADLEFESPDLTIPHVEMTHRAFVLVPLSEIAPHVVHPTTGRTVRELLNDLGDPAGVSVYSANRSSENGLPSL